MTFRYGRHFHGKKLPKHIYSNDYIAIIISTLTELSENWHSVRFNPSKR